MAEKSTRFARDDFDEFGRLTDELVRVLSFRVGGKELVPTPSTFQIAHVGELKTVLQGYLRAPKRVPLPLAGLARGGITPDTKRAFSGRRVDVREFSEDNVFWVTSAVIKPVTIDYTFSGILERTAHLDELSVDLVRMFHNSVYQFSVDYEEWGRMGCTLRMDGGIEDATEVIDDDRVVGFNVPLTVEATVFQEARTERRVTRVGLSLTETMVWEGEVP